jgi:outer membrane usher protein
MPVSSRSRFQLSTRSGRTLAIALLLACKPLAAAEPTGLSPLLLDVRLNGLSVSEELFLRAAHGRLLVRRAALTGWRILSDPPDAAVVDGEAYVALADMNLIRSDLDEGSQTIDIAVRPKQFAPTVASVAGVPDGPMSPSPLGAFLNYDAFIERSSGATAANAALEAGLFTGSGVGVTNLILRADRDRFRAVRLDTNWTIVNPDRMTAVRLGDSISRGGVGTVPVRFGGVQWSREFGVRPGFLSLPLPDVAGSAALPSVVDIYVDGALRASRPVAPGPFRINDVPVATGGGQVRAVVRDVLGREVASALDYYTSSQSLRHGLHDFSYEAGVLRRHYALRSNDYGTAFFSATHRYGLTDTLTVEGHAVLADQRQNIGAGAVAMLPQVGLFTIGASASHGAKGAGAALTASVERRINGFAAGLRTELTSRDYGFLGLPAFRAAPKASLVAFADASFGSATIGCNYIRRRSWDRAGESVFGLFGSVNVGRKASLYFNLQHVRIGEPRTIASMNLTVPIGRRGSAAAGVQGGSGTMLASVSAQLDPPAGEGWGVRGRATRGDLDSEEAQLTWQGASLAADVRAVRIERATAVRAQVSGGIGAMDDHLFVSRKLGQSFALVDVSGRPGVRVYADNQLVAVTGRDGYAVVPGLRPFERNRVAIDPTDVPIDVELGQTEQTVRPFGRAGVIVQFAAGQATNALVRLKHDDQPIPAGASVTLNGGQSGVVAPGGDVYLRGVGKASVGRVSWGGKSCDFIVDPETLGAAAKPVLQCRRPVDVVAR